MINCLMNTGGRVISEEVRNLLFRKAKEMYHKGHKRLKLKHSFCAGIIVTELKYGSMGMISGLEFKAEIIVETGETTVTFLVRSTDLDDNNDSGWGAATLRDIESLDAMEERQQLPQNRLN